MSDAPPLTRGQSKTLAWALDENDPQNLDVADALLAIVPALLDRHERTVEVIDAIKAAHVEIMSGRHGDDMVAFYNGQIDAALRLLD